MAEYIKRESYTCKDCFHWVACKKMLEAAGYIVSENYKPDASRCDTFIPTADVVEVVHGHWVGLEYDGFADGCPVYDLWECSECGNEVRGEDVPDTHPYCNGCGARMDGDGRCVR